MSVYLRKNKILFLHIPKTAGSSIRRSLETIEKIVDVPTNKSKTNWHSTYKDCKIHIPDIQDYQKFTVIRNPWDRVCSWYFFRKELLENEIHKMQKGIKSRRFINDIERLSAELSVMKNDFNDWFLKYYNVPWDYTWFSLSHSQSFWLGDGKFDIIKFENISEDIKKIKQLANNKLPHKRKTQNVLHKYQDIFDNKTKDLVYQIYKEDIIKFDYEF